MNKSAQVDQRIWIVILVLIVIILNVAKTPELKKGTGKSCISNEECLSVRCKNNICDCSNFYENCKEKLDCCYGRCEEGTCKCSSRTQSCSSDKDCCESLKCINNTCSVTSSECNFYRENLEFWLPYAVIFLLVFFFYIIPNFPRVLSTEVFRYQDENRNFRITVIGLVIVASIIIYLKLMC